jgi:hypothetical protein
MKARPGNRLRKRGVRFGIIHVVGLIASTLVASWLDYSRRRRVRVRARVPKTADERTMRRIAEAQAGGMSSEEGRARWERGDHPGGLHGKAEKPPADAELFEVEEPHDRTEMHRGSKRGGMSSMRR